MKNRSDEPIFHSARFAIARLAMEAPQTLRIPSEEPHSRLSPRVSRAKRFDMKGKVLKNTRIKWFTGWLLSAAILFAVSGSWACARTSPDTMVITAIDLQAENTGEATMISDGYGKSLLVDSGDNKNRSIFDWLDANGYKKKEFDTLITHWHDDHAGNTAEIIRRYKVGTLYLPTLEYLDVDYPEYQGHYDYEKTIAQEVLKAAKECGTKLVYLEKGLTINVGEVTGEVLYCSDCPLKENWYAVQHVNNQSAAIMFSGGGVKLFMAGDVQAQAEKRILKSDVSIKADIFKLSHHGTDRSNTQDFLDAVDPSYAWFSSNKSTPEQLIAAGDLTDSVTRMEEMCEVLSTRYNGTIRFRCSGGEIEVTVERNR